MELLLGRIVIQQEPVAIQLGYLRTLVEIGAEQSTTIVFPLPVDLVCFDKPGAEPINRQRHPGKPAARGGRSGSTPRHCRRPGRTAAVKRQTGQEQRGLMMKSTSCRTGPQMACKPPPSLHLDQALWAAWIQKGRAHDKRVSTELWKGLRGLSMMALVVAAASWSNLLPYDGVARFALSAAALAAAFLFFYGRQYTMAAVAGAVALVSNPVAPALSLAGDWRRTLMVVAAVLLVASFAGFERRKAQND